MQSVSSLREAEMQRAGTAQSEVHFGDDSILMVFAASPRIVNGTTAKLVRCERYAAPLKACRAIERESSSAVGVQMNVSKWQWIVVFALDVLFKFMLAYGGAILASLGLVVLAGIGYVVEFVIAAVSMSSLNAVYLLLGQRVVAALDRPWLVRHPLLQAGSILICANAMFSGSLISLFSFHGGFFQSAIFSLFFVVTNLVPIVIVAIFGWSWTLISRVLRRR